MNSLQVFHAAGNTPPSVSAPTEVHEAYLQTTCPFEKETSSSDISELHDVDTQTSALIEEHETTDSCDSATFETSETNIRILRWINDLETLVPDANAVDELTWQTSNLVHEQETPLSDIAGDDESDLEPPNLVFEQESSLSDSAEPHEIDMHSLSLFYDEDSSISGTTRNHEVDTQIPGPINELETSNHNAADPHENGPQISTSIQEQDTSTPNTTGTHGIGPQFATLIDEQETPSHNATETSNVVPPIASKPIKKQDMPKPGLTEFSKIDWDIPKLVREPTPTWKQRILLLFSSQERKRALLQKWGLKEHSKRMREGLGPYQMPKKAGSKAATQDAKNPAKAFLLENVRGRNKEILLSSLREKFLYEAEHRQLFTEQKEQYVSLFTPDIDRRLSETRSANFLARNARGKSSGHILKPLSIPEFSKMGGDAAAASLFNTVLLICPRELESASDFHERRDYLPIPDVSDWEEQTACMYQSLYPNEPAERLPYIYGRDEREVLAMIATVHQRQGSQVEVFNVLRVRYRAELEAAARLGGRAVDRPVLSVGADRPPFPSSGWA
ncbi:MAG: hypothetical protein M1818_005876 [Claussenomyces sp. TS43310]|nr:MAG: hypothetical protein M1818_005876 [Claussenomyces sp. TS43310]